MFHAVAPVHGASDGVQHRVNIDGTNTLLEACRHPSVSSAVAKLVYTSSTGVVWSARDIIGASEDDLPMPAQGYDSYHHSKGIAEKIILAENGNGLCTVALRPCGMIGYGFQTFYVASLLTSHKSQRPTTYSQVG